MADYQIIDNRRELEALVPRLLTEPAVAFDTEADSFYHYREKICLLQVATPSRPQFAYLIDPLAMGGPANLILLAPVFASEQIRVIFHAAEYDLFLLKRDCGISIANLFDTMISAQLLGYPSIGLAALAKAHFDVTLPKEEQRSDWSTRPLSEEQLRYAAMDVYYLVELAERLDAELHAKARWSWAQEEFLALCNREVPARTFDEYGYLKLKGARHLPPRNLSVLRELYVMRDAEARQIDRPAFMILSPNTIIDLAERAPRTKLEIAKTKGVGEKTLRRLGTQILDAIERGLAQPHAPVPKASNNGRFARRDKETERRLAQLKAWRGERARGLELDPGVLCPNASLEAIAILNPAAFEQLAGLPMLKEWFVREFGSELVNVLSQQQ